MFGLLLLNEEVYEPLPFLRWTNASASELIARTDRRALHSHLEIITWPPGGAAAAWRIDNTSDSACLSLVLLDFLLSRVNYADAITTMCLVFSRSPAGWR